MPLALSHGGRNICTSTSPSNEVLVGTLDGAVLIERKAKGAEWRVANGALRGQHISTLIEEPQSGLIFAGVFHGGIHASADGGKTWEPRDNGLTERDVYTITTYRLNGKTRLYAGTEPAHLYFSDDLGRHWSELPALRSVPSVPQWTFPGPPHIAHLKHINFDPRDPSTIYGSIEVGGLLKSTDLGKTWVDIPGMYADVHRTVIRPDNPKRIYITGGDGLYVTSDGGATWEHWVTKEHELGGYPDQLVFHPRQPDLMFISSAHNSPGTWRATRTSGSRVSRSRDGGRTWEVLRNGLPDRMDGAVEAMSLEAWGDSFAIYFANTAGEVYCGEEGNSWSKIIDGLAPISKGGHYRNVSGEQRGAHAAT